MALEGFMGFLLGCSLSCFLQGLTCCVVDLSFFSFLEFSFFIFVNCIGISLCGFGCFGGRGVGKAVDLQQ